MSQTLWNVEKGGWKLAQKLMNVLSKFSTCFWVEKIKIIYACIRSLLLLIIKQLVSF